MKQRLSVLSSIVGLALMVALLVRCGGNSSDPNAPVPMPPNPNTPVDPNVPVVPAPEHYRGFKKQPGYGLHVGAPAVLADRVGELPVKFSWVTAGFDIPVKNQSSCGSCWAFSTVENMEWAVNIFLGKNLVLAPQYLVGKDFYGCGGGDFDGDTEVSDGLPLESDCPYQANNSSCSSSAKIAAKAISAINIGDGTNSPTVVQLKEALMQYGPLSVDVAASASWDSYKGGVKASCGGTSIDHMVVIYAWDDTQGSKGVWYIRNSWKDSWGDHGNMIMPYGCDSVAQDASTVLVKPIATYTVK